MKKTAILIYESFCNFEISVVLEMLAMAQKEITIIGRTKEAVKSEEGLVVVPELAIEQVEFDNYDSLILPGAMDIREAIEDTAIIDFIKNFDGKIIGAISIAPILLVRAGMLNEKNFMAGINKEELMEEGFTEKDLANMIGWDKNIENPVKEGYVISGNIITSVSYEFVKWSLGFGSLLGIDISPKTFGIEA